MQLIPPPVLRTLFPMSNTWRLVQLHKLAMTPFYATQAYWDAYCSTIQELLTSPSAPAVKPSKVRKAHHH